MVLYFGLKVPFGLQCFAHVCLARRFGLAFFSKAHVTLVVALLFGGLVLLPAFLQSFIQSAFVPPLQPGHTSSWKGLHVSTSGWAVFLTLPLMREYIFFPGKARAAGFLLFILVRRCCKQSWKNGSLCLRFLLRFAFGFGKLNKTKNPSIYHSCPRNTATLPISQRPLLLSESSPAQMLHDDISFGSRVPFGFVDLSCYSIRIHGP